MTYRRGYTEWALNIPARITGGEPEFRWGIQDEVAGHFEVVRIGDRQVAKRIEDADAGR